MKSITKLFETDAKYWVISIEPVNDDKLIRQLEGKGIKKEVASQYLSELSLITKREGHMQYNALGMKNEDGGYALCNGGSIGNATITFIKGLSDSIKEVHLFMNLIDFLSHASVGSNGKFEHHAVILNHNASILRACRTIESYQTVCSWFDNTTAGSRLTTTLNDFIKSKEGVEHLPMNHVYHEFASVSEWHIRKNLHLQ